MKKLLLLLILPLMITSCKQEINQPKILEDKCSFDLEQINFSEDIPKLYSKHFINDYEYDMEKEYNPNEKFSDTIFRYRINNIITETMKFKVPMKEFGYLYKTPEIDSVAKFQNIYFNTIYSLTNISKKPVAYYAEARYENSNLRKQHLNELIKKYGEPKYSFLVNREFNQCSYEWDLNDRTIQVETSFGWSVSATSDGKSKSGKYYRLDLLIMENKYKNEIYDAHILEIPDKIMYEGKFHSYKDFQFEKTSRVKDEFLLNSTIEELTKDEYGEHNIINAAKDE